MSRVWPWAGAFAGTFAAGWLLGAAGLPSAYMFSALFVGLAIALARPGRLAVPAGAFRVSQAITGVALGAYLQSDALRAAADAWLSVSLVSIATLLISLACGVMLARFTVLDRPTAALGMVAGGASGIVAMAGELRADDRLVAFMQYLRVLVVVVATPLLVALAFPGGHAGAPQDDVGVLGDVEGWALTLLLAPAGIAVAKVTRLPAGSLMGPMLVAGAVGLTVSGGFSVPPILRETAFADPSSFFHRYAGLTDDEAVATATDVWMHINRPNLVENILPTRGRATLVLTKGPDHAVTNVRLRKL